MLKNFDLKKYVPKVVLNLFVVDKTAPVLPKTNFRVAVKTAISIADSSKRPVYVQPGNYLLTVRVVNEIDYLCVDGDQNRRAPRAYWQAQLEKGNISI